MLQKKKALFKKKAFGEHSFIFTCPIFGPLVPYFGFLVASPLGFKARASSTLLELQMAKGKRNVHPLRSTSGATHYQPLDGQQCGYGPTWPPIGTLSKP